MSSKTRDELVTEIKKIDIRRRTLMAELKAAKEAQESALLKLAKATFRKHNLVGKFEISSVTSNYLHWHFVIFLGQKTLGWFNTADEMVQLIQGLPESIDAKTSVRTDLGDVGRQYLAALGAHKK